MQVLVAQDNATNRLVIRKLLENWGATINLAVNGAEAITQFETTSHDVDIILLECHLAFKEGCAIHRNLNPCLTRKIANLNVVMFLPLEFHIGPNVLRLFPRRLSSLS